MRRLANTDSSVGGLPEVKFRVRDPLLWPFWAHYPRCRCLVSTKQGEIVPTTRRKGLDSMKKRIRPYKPYVAGAH
jgi:hypothetical protein